MCWFGFGIDWRRRFYFDGSYFIYLMYVNPVTAKAYSLFVVGVSSTFGAVQNIKKKLVDFKTAVVFAIPAFIAVYLTRKYLVPAIPQEVLSIGDFTD